MLLKLSSKKKEKHASLKIETRFKKSYIYSVFAHWDRQGAGQGKISLNEK